MKVFELAKERRNGSTESIYAKKQTKHIVAQKS